MTTPQDGKMREEVCTESKKKKEWPHNVALWAFPMLTVLQPLHFVSIETVCLSTYENIAGMRTRVNPPV